MTSPLSPAQQVFNQRLLSERCVDQKTAKALYREISATFENEGLSFQQALSSSNLQLDFFGLEIVMVSINKNDGEQPMMYYALTNKMATDEVSKQTLHSMAFPYGPAEQAMMVDILEHLVEKKQVSKNTLINLRTTTSSAEHDGKQDRLTLTEAQDTVERLLHDKWLMATTDGGKKLYQLGPRTYCELPHFLTEHLGLPTAELPQRIIL